MLTNRDIADLAVSHRVIDSFIDPDDAVASIRERIASGDRRAVEFLRANPQLQAISGQSVNRWPYQAIRLTDTRHLLLHVYAAKGRDCWRTVIERVRSRLDVFNGRRIVAIASDASTHPPELVERELPGCEFLHLPNDPLLRETATLLPLLLSVYSNPGATLYLHTKGTSTTENRVGSARWTNAMLHYLLCDWQRCFELLKDYVAVGTTKMVWPNVSDAPYPSGLKRGLHMLAGTFFWFRNDFVFSSPKWRDIPADRYGCESWLAGLFPPVATVSVFQPWPVWQYPTPSPYDPALYPEEFDEPCQCP